MYKGFYSRFRYSRDTLFSFRKIDKLSISKIFNCGYSKGISVLDVAKEFKRQSSKKVKIIYTQKRKNDLIKIIASNNNLKKFIKWKPKFNNLVKS